MIVNINIPQIILPNESQKEFPLVATRSVSPKCQAEISKKIKRLMLGK
jgi:hypothetical protein